MIVNSPDTDTGILIGNQVYPLALSPKSTILWQGTAPSNVTYSYVRIEKGTSRVIEREPFNRRAIQNDTVNEFFNRNWNTKPMATFGTIQDISKNFNRQFDNQLLHPIGEVPTIHIVAAQSDIDNIHKNYLDDITIISNMTYIRYIACSYKKITATNMYAVQALSKHLQM